MEETLVRVRVPKPKTPDFCLEKLEKARRALKEEAKFLETCRKEVAAREEQVEYL